MSDDAWLKTLLFLIQVHYIQYIRDQTSKEVRNAEIAVLTGNYQDAENVLLQVRVLRTFVEPVVD